LEPWAARRRDCEDSIATAAAAEVPRGAGEVEGRGRGAKELFGGFVDDRRLVEELPKATSVRVGLQMDRLARAATRGKRFNKRL